MLRNGAARIRVVAMTVAAVKPCARSFSRPPPAGEKSGRVLAGICREGRSQGRGQVKGLHWSAADTVAAVAANGGRRSVAGLRDAALVALASDFPLRVSEAVAVQVVDLAAEPDGSGRRTVHRSKTDQEGRGAVLYVGESTMRRIAALRDAARLDDGPLFRHIRQGDKVESSTIADCAARSIIRARAAETGIEGNVSGRGLRIGAAPNSLRRQTRAIPTATPQRLASRGRNPARLGRCTAPMVAGLDHGHRPSPRRARLRCASPVHQVA